MNTLPVELVTLITGFLDSTGIFCLKCVCKSFSWIPKQSEKPCCTARKKGYIAILRWFQERRYRVCCAKAGISALYEDKVEHLLWLLSGKSIFTYHVNYLLLDVAGKGYKETTILLLSRCSRPKDAINPCVSALRRAFACKRFELADLVDAKFPEWRLPRPAPTDRSVIKYRQPLEDLFALVSHATETDNVQALRWLNSRVPAIVQIRIAYALNKATLPKCVPE